MGSDLVPLHRLIELGQGWGPLLFGLDMLTMKIFAGRVQQVLLSGVPKI
jgi:hypothetical protein